MTESGLGNLKCNLWVIYNVTFIGPSYVTIQFGKDDEAFLLLIVLP